MSKLILGIKKFSRWSTGTDGQQVHETMINITIHQENANKPTVRYNFISISMNIIKHTHKNDKCLRGWEEKGTFVHCWQECNLVQPL